MHVCIVVYVHMCIYYKFLIQVLSESYNSSNPLYFYSPTVSGVIPEPPEGAPGTY